MLSIRYLADRQNSAAEGRKEGVFVNRFAAYSVMVLSTLIGGGSLLLFVAFVIAGPFAVIRFNISEAQALIWDGFLSLVFFIQHSGMIRASFRDRRSSAVPRHLHPAFYSIVSGLLLIAVILLWQTSQTILFRIQGPLHWLPLAISSLALTGIIWASLAFRTFDPFGRIPIKVHLRGRQLRPPVFNLRGPYFWVRHPLYFFMLVLVWSTPDVSSDRLLFIVLWTSWTIVGAHLEERDLVAEFGDKYRQYQKTVPMLIPWRGPVGRGL
jgi:methanethiol S-methyltransferase